MDTESLSKYAYHIPEIKYILLMFFSTRIILNIIGVLSRNLIQQEYSYQSNSMPPLRWLDVWGAWDTGWYLDISLNGYSTIQNQIHQTNIAFFPLYPTLMRIIGSITGNHYIAGLIISNFCLIVACIYLYRLVKLDFEETNAIKSVKYLLIFPVSFILSGVFSESLYLTLILICFYYARKGEWYLVGITGFFLSLTRSVGVLVVLPLLYEVLMPLIKENRTIISLKNSREVIIPVFYLSLIPLGTVFFMVYNYYITGDFLAFMHAQAMWERHLTNPLEVIIDGFSGDIFTAFEAAFATISIFILIIFYRKMRFSYWLFSMFSIFIPLSTGIMSMPRYILVIFPLYILFADITKNRVSEDIITLIFCLFQGFLMIFWTTGCRLVM
ncbi:hypothetical protein [Methanosarcina sp.]|jgi:hypothetical protein|uniref:hypothetical protein n=1 Tax=Methanosarcina sp. TaxID=2213 RepID=UPI002C5C226D|nr:hypothetical protein [Methanosarcina sp.]HOW14886.1 hypothetical protein [Methanosarcina sp.]